MNCDEKNKGISGSGTLPHMAFRRYYCDLGHDYIYLYDDAQEDDQEQGLIFLLSCLGFTQVKVNDLNPCFDLEVLWAKDKAKGADRCK